MHFPPNRSLVTPLPEIMDEQFLQSTFLSLESNRNFLTHYFILLTAHIQRKIIRRRLRDCRGIFSRCISFTSTISCSARLGILCRVKVQAIYLFPDRRMNWSILSLIKQIRPAVGNAGFVDCVMQTLRDSAKFFITGSVQNDTRPLLFKPKTEWAKYFLLGKYARGSNFYMNSCKITEVGKCLKRYF